MSYSESYSNYGFNLEGTYIFGKINLGFIFIVFEKFYIDISDDLKYWLLLTYPYLAVLKLVISLILIFSIFWKFLE